jgi:hypothetical protein
MSLNITIIASRLLRLSQKFAFCNNDRNNLTFFSQKTKSFRAFFAKNDSKRFSLSTLVHSDLGLGRGLGDAVNLNVNLKIPRSREKEFRGKL